MNDKLLPSDRVFENDTVYHADRREYHYYAKDTVLADVARDKNKGRNLNHRPPLSTVFYLKNKKNITLDFGGAVVVLHGKLQPFVLEGCENVTLKNVTVRYDRSPFTQGTIEYVGESEFGLRVGDAFPYRVEDSELIMMSDTWENHDLDKAPMFLQIFDAKTRLGAGMHLAVYGKHHTPNPTVPWEKTTYHFLPEERDGLLVLKKQNDLPMPTLKVGQVAVMAHEARDLSSVLLSCCKNTVISDYRILNGCGMGIYSFHCENILLERLKMTYDESSPSFIANAADGIHAFSTLGDYTLRDCVVEGTIDDALNIHSNFYKVLRAEGNRLITTPCLECEPLTPCFPAGDRLRHFKGYSLESRGDYTILASEPYEEDYLALTLDRPVDEWQENDVIENLSTQCRIHISGCTFNKSTTHLRFQTRGEILVENCLIGMPLLLTGDMTYWFESSPCEHFHVKNCTFVGERGFVQATPEFLPTEKEPYYHKEVTLEDCTFEASHMMNAHFVERITLNNCRRNGGGTLSLTAAACGTVDAPGCELEKQDLPLGVIPEY